MPAITGSYDARAWRVSRPSDLFYTRATRHVERVVTTPQPTRRMSAPLVYAQKNAEAFRTELFDFLRIPSVSARSEHDADTHRAAEWLAGRLAQAGLESEVIETPGHPVVLGEWRRRRADRAHLWSLRCATG